MQEGKDRRGSVFTSREVASNFSAVVASVIMRHYTLLKRRRRRRTRSRWRIYLEGLFALLESDGVGVLGALSHRELDIDVQPVGATSVDERRTQPVVDGRHGHVAHHVHSVDVATGSRVTRLAPLSSDIRSFIFLPRDAMLARYMLSSSCVRPSAHPFVTSRYCIETSGRIELVLGTEASFHVSHTVEIWVSPKIGLRVLPCGIFVTKSGISTRQVDALSTKLVGGRACSSSSLAIVI